MKGLVGKKAGMTYVFSETGDEIPVTVLEMGPCHVTQVKTVEKEGYSAAQIAFDPFTKKKAEKMKKPRRGLFEKINVKPAKILREVRLDKTETAPNVGDELKVDIFEGMTHVSVTAVTKGRGFAGVVKKYGMKGAASMTHGSHEQFRHPGSMGMHAQPARVLKGKKLPGHYGAELQKALNLEIVRTFPERNLLLVKGSVPGPTGGIVMVEKSVRGKIRKGPAEQAKAKGKKK